METRTRSPTTETLTFISTHPFIPTSPTSLNTVLGRRTTTTTAPRFKSLKTFRFSVLACQTNSSSRSSSTPTTTKLTNAPPQDEEALTPQAPFLDPKVAPSLLQKPESVLTILTLGFLSTIAFLARSARRITADVATRTNFVLATRNLETRLRARMREKSFLESAFDATQATLQNTTSYLDVQRKRAAIAEERLHRLEAQQEDLQQAEEKRLGLSEQLQQAEKALAAQTQLTATDEQSILELRQTVDRYGAQLTTFSKDLERVSDNLREAQRTDETDLQTARDKIASLEAQLHENNRLMEEANGAKQRVESEHETSASQVEALDLAVKDTLSEVEQHRRAIDEMLERTEAVKQEVNRKRDDMFTTRDDQQPIYEMRSKIADMDTQHESVKQTMTRLETREEEIEQERNALMQQLNAKDEDVRTLREKLSRLQSAQHQERTDINKLDGNEPSTQPETVTTESKQDYLHASILQVNDDLEAQTPEAASPSTLAEATATPSRRTRGRPRKSTAAAVKSTSDQVGSKSRRRSRARKQQDTTDTDTETANIYKKDATQKRKRGRPRKNAVAQPTSQ